MLHRSYIASLEKRHRKERVLSVFVNGSLADPAMKHGWRLSLNAAIAETRRRLNNRTPGSRLSSDL